MTASSATVRLLGAVKYKYLVPMYIQVKVHVLLNVSALLAYKLEVLFILLAKVVQNDNSYNTDKEKHTDSLKALDSIAVNTDNITCTVETPSKDNPEMRTPSF